MSDHFDIGVVGAGPAGLAAAVAAAEAGSRIVLVDAADQPGGQYWRHPDESVRRGDESAGHHGWKTFTSVRARLRAQCSAGRITHLAGSQVWFVERGNAGAGHHRIHLTPASTGERDTAAPASVALSSLVLCPGAYDRQIPLDGWDLPGVMAAGGVQALLKGHRPLPGPRAVVAGPGPFLLPVARGLAEAGAEVVAVCEANSPAGWARDVRGALSVPSKVVEAAEYGAALARHRIPYRTRTTVTSIGGTDRVQSATLSELDRSGNVRGSAGTEDVDLVALGWGFTPALELITAVGAETTKDADDSLVAMVDDMQRCSVPGVYAAGEATGVGGAAAALAEGELAGIAAATDLGQQQRNERVTRLTRSISRARRFARAMARAHPVPRAWRHWLSDSTTVCRCEEVTLADVENARDALGAEDARTVKLLARPGMGRCQGRICGFATADLAAAQEGRELTADDLRPIAKRPFCAPVSLEHLADDSS